MKKANGYILAGGKSSRMGTDKGLMLFGDKPLIVYAIEQMKSVFEKVVIVSNNHEYEKFGHEVIPDIIKDKGPAGGIYAALKHSTTKMNCIVSCDMPFITKEGIQFMLENAVESEITLVENQGFLEPLFGIYSKECDSKWLELINQNHFKLQEMVLNFQLKKIQIETNEIFKNSYFRNINTKFDVENS